MSLLSKANKNRSRENSDQNDAYSKSTAVFSITIEGYSKKDKQKSKVLNNYERKIGNLILVDLAGSEKITGKYYTLIYSMSTYIFY